MHHFKRIVLVAFTLVLISETLYAKDSAENVSKTATDAKSFRCEKVRGATLAEIKGKLIDHCNLNKPFSLSASEALSGKEIYTFCCHTS